MPDTNTANYNLVQPEVNASRDTWGTKTNSNMGIIDTQIKNRSNEITAAVKNALAQVMAFGQGGPQLTLSGSSLLLIPLRGNSMVVNDKIVTLSNSGISLSVSGLAANTLYYIYAADTNNDGTVDALEASTTGIALTADIRFPVKSGDASRSFVGLARTNGSTQWADNDAQRFVRSFYNRSPLKLFRSLAPSISMGSALAEVSSAGRIEFISLDEMVDITAIAEVTANTPAANYISMGVSIDGIAPTPVSFLATNSANGMALVSRVVANTGLGYHYASQFGKGGASYSGIFNSLWLTGRLG